MGLIKALSSATSGTMADQWKEFFYCDSLDQDTLVVRGQKKTSSRSSNTKGNDNIISNGSGISVADGQCMIIVEQGKIVDVCAEPGLFTYNTSTAPSVFVGSLGDGIKGVFNTIGKRFTYGGDTGADQRVYYFNIKELMSNKLGTANPIPFRVVDKNIGLDVDVSIRCSGTYSYKITNPLLFYANVCGNIEKNFKKDKIDTQLKSEFISALQPAIAKLSSLEIRPNSIPSYTEELTSHLNNVLTKKWAELRGLSVIAVAFNSIVLPDEDAEMIKKLQKSAVLRDTKMAAATLVEAQASAMQTAAANENGAMMGFMGMGMAQTAGGVNATSLYQMNENETNVQTSQNNGEWKCSCGHMNFNNFCTNCGSKKPSTVAYKCDKCGWVPNDKESIPNFCPQCGDRFDENDKEA